MRKTAGKVATACADALSDKGGGGIADAITRHITKTLGGDGKRIGGNGKDAQGRHNDSGHDLGTAHDDMLAAHRQTDVERTDQRVAPDAEPAIRMIEPQLGRTEKQIPQHRQRGGDIGQDRADGSPCHTQPSSRHIELQTKERDHTGGEDEQKIEKDIEHAHQHIEQRRNEHIATATEHTAGQTAELPDRHDQTENEEIDGGIVIDGRRAPQPLRKHPTDGAAHNHERETENQQHQHGLAEHIAGFGLMARTDAVGHLHREASGSRTAKARDQPTAGGDQTDGSSGIGPQTAHHGRINILHDNGGKLRQNGGRAELENQHQLFPRRHRLACADACQQVIPSNHK